MRAHTLIGLALTTSAVSCSAVIRELTFDGFEDRSSALPANSGSTTDVQLVDVDRDGDLDIVWANQLWPTGAMPTQTGGVDITINDGGGRFHRSEQPGLAIIDHAQFITPVDVDNDRDTDLVVSRAAKGPTGPAIFLLLNDGVGNYTVGAFPAVIGPVDGVAYGHVAAGDFDADGLVDLILPIWGDVANTQGMPDIYFANRGGGVFERDTTGRLPMVDPTRDWTLSIAVGDVNGDGSLDLYMGQAEREQRLYLNDGTGRFTDRTDMSGSPTDPGLPSTILRAVQSVMVDFDDDRDLDIVVINDASITTGTPVPRQNLLFRNDGRGRFDLGWMAPAMRTYDSRGLAFGDINRDGELDIVVANATSTLSHNGDAIQIAFGTPTGDVVPMDAVRRADSGIFGVAIGDLNGDGFADIVGASAEPDPTGGLADLLFLSTAHP